MKDVLHFLTLLPFQGIIQKEDRTSLPREEEIKRKTPLSANPHLSDRKLRHNTQKEDETTTTTTGKGDVHKS